MRPTAENINYGKTVRGDDNVIFWGNMPFSSREIWQPFEGSGWCQYIRGPKGASVKGLASHTYNLTGEDELKAPVEVAMPDYHELELANAGFIPPISKKGSSMQYSSAHKW